jgi:hypothetical protein
LKYSSKSIVIIGEGAWSSKISKILLEQDHNLEIIKYSARDFILKSKQQVSKIASNHILWITTTPDLQFDVLRKIEDFNCKVILEKPLATNFSKLEELLEFIPSIKPDLFLSEPWGYSQIWNKIKTNIESLPKPISIKIKRGGPVMRTYMSPVFDWMYHDLGLISELISNYNKSLSIRSSFKDVNNMSFNLTIPDEITIDISIGYFLEKIATWEVNNKYTFDFNDSSNEKDSPITTMYLNIQNRTGNDLSEQLWLVRRITELIS